MQAAGYYATAAVAGIIGGWTFAWIWARLVPSSVQGRFWSTLSGVAKSMLAAERSREFLDLYRRLGSSVVRYVARNVGGLLLACLPIIALTYALDMSVFGPWDMKAGGPTVYPRGAATLHQRDADSPLELDIGATRQSIAIERDVPVRAAVCWGTLQCVLLQSLRFSVTVSDAPGDADYRAVIVRPDDASRNPLFPYLNDLEFLFFGTIAVGAAAALIVRRKPA